ncbi:hypothetical protein BXO88_08650 [Oribacterium sp. C9]|uniref:hypothetical protein n=1 Tax=Oribacterium sp. C9 TaxID=1943579 RepID=UPI00098FEBFB|nr:hypothetical protein [Oribacterium sp. C9]OON86111.1 hypothetical protein BXO88_08650 [Oribacterium sp. C9]
MIVYYKWMANLMMAVGAVLGAVLGWIHFGGNILNNENKTAIFVFALFIFAGIIVFRFVGAIVASKKLNQVQGILYAEADPKRFLETFAPVNEKVPHDLAEYANGQNWISYAKEAMGDLDGAWDAIKELKPNELKIHALTTSALIVNQKANLQILRRDFEAAEFQIEDLKHLKELAEKRAKMLAENLAQQIRVHEARIAAAKGMENADIKYLEEEIQYATNAIYRKEMQLEVAEYYLRKGNKDKESYDKAMALLHDIVKDIKGLYTEKRAEELIKNPEKLYTYEEDNDGFVVIRE